MNRTLGTGSETENEGPDANLEQTFATKPGTGNKGPGRLRLSGWASGRVASVPSFSGIIDAGPDFAGSCHRLSVVK